MQKKRKKREKNRDIHVRIVPVTAACSESSPLWNVDCFSLSARPQVRWRERRRCDYQAASGMMPGDADCKRPMAGEVHQLQQPQQTVQMITADGRPGNHGNNNHARMLIKRGGGGDDDSSHDECDQTQC